MGHDRMKKAVVIAHMASMIENFEKPNILLLKKLGYEVSVITNFLNTDSMSKERYQKLKTFLKDNEVVYYDLNIKRNPMHPWNVVMLIKMWWIMRQEQIELVHCHTPVGGVLGRISAKLSGVKKIIYTAHGFHFFKGASKLSWMIFYPIEKCLSRITDILITMNSQDYQLANEKFYMKQLYKINGVGIDHVKYGLVSDRDYERKNNLVFLSVGELNKNKNHEVVIKGLELLKKEHPKINFEYKIIGTGSLKNSLQNLINSLGLEENVCLLGYSLDVKRYLEQSDIFIFPSFREGLPVSVMEAMSNQLPVLCSNIRGNSDLIDDKLGGFLFEPNDEVSFYHKLIELIMNSERIKMGKYNADKIKQFSIVAIEKKMKTIYQSLFEQDEITENSL